MLGLLLWKHGHGERAMAHRRQAVALLDGAAPSPAKAAVLASLTAALAGGGHSAEAIETGRQALAMAEALGLDQQQARTLNYLGWARIDSGDAGGIGDLERAVAVAVRANLPDTVTVYGNLANAVIGAGDLTRGFELQAKALEAAERFGLASDLRTSRWEQISQDYWQGHWDAAMETADQLLAAADAGSEHFMERAGRQMRGLVRLARGDLPGALADAARAPHQPGLGGGPGHRPPGAGTVGRADQARRRRRHPDALAGGGGRRRHGRLRAGGRAVRRHRVAP